ncbi:MAG: FKBP-type peptidyl-prolyl cis-trans isomerase [Hyphomonadaceae bacterium]|nr:FKBP-type peptidyl-prolyl cis-trans isomerase [Hyphomonadaceae bacterium]
MRKLFAALGGLILAACGGETMDPNDPLATYIPWNPDAEGVQTTESGLQYVIVREGDADGISPGPEDEVRVMYDGRLVDGTVFDSSYARGEPISFGVHQVIPGWTEGLQLMSVGDEYVFYIPTELGYGANPRPGGVIKPGDDLIFRVELQDIVKAPEPIPSNLEAWEKYTPWTPDAEEVQTTESGLQYVVLREGEEGGVSPGPRDEVSVFYEGRLVDGTVFDSAYERGEPISFGVNQVIPGWTEGLQLMSVGDQYMFYIPSNIAYGDRPRPGGLIKPGDDLVFQVELKEVVKAPEPRPTDDEAWQTYTPWNSDLPEVQKTGTGLEYVVLASGDESGVSPEGGEYVAVFYEGRLNEGGEVFDSAFQRGEAAMFPANRVIPGWVEALKLMKPGDRWLVHVPGNLAYGPRGNGPIPPDAALNFEVELMDVMPVR